MRIRVPQRQNWLGSYYGILYAFRVHIMGCDMYQLRGIIEKEMGPICPYICVYGIDGHEMVDMMLVSHWKTPSLLEFGWIWHAFAAIYMYMYSWYIITQAYHAYLVTMKSYVVHGGYLNFSFCWYLYYPFYNKYLWFYFPSYIPVSSIRTDAPLP